MLATTRAAAVLPTLITLTVGAVACAGQDEQAAQHTSTPPTTSPPASTPSTPTASPSPSPSETVQLIEVEIKDGKVFPDPSRRVQVERGQTVRIILTSDQTDELHVHGYDLHRPVAAGGSVTVEFVADQSGQFEVEVHELARPLLFTLQVR